MGLEALGQWPPTFLVPGTDVHGLVYEDGLGMIRARDINGVLYF